LLIQFFIKPYQLSGGATALATIALGSILSVVSPDSAEFVNNLLNAGIQHDWRLYENLAFLGGLYGFAKGGIGEKGYKLYPLGLTNLIR
jgi:hypothetical protein